jgi:formylglycine-generating enzyme required for sulfatase activity
VRIEVETAIQRDIPVIPVLVGGASMPTPAEIPESLSEFSFRNAANVDSGRNFDNDIDRLMRSMDHLFGTEITPSSFVRAAGVRHDVTGAGGAEQPKSEAAAKVRAITIEIGPLGRRTTPKYFPGEGKTSWFSDVLEGPEMVLFPPGKFLMGSPPDQEGRWETHEGPQHEVLIHEPFAMGRFAVTVAEFTAFIEATDYPMPPGLYTYEGSWALRTNRSFRDPGFRQTARHPVVGVNWDDAKAYIAWLIEKTGQQYRLPSEAEWEYAARAGTTTAFWWGDFISTAQANYNGQPYGTGTRGEYRGGTVPVDNFEPNPWGLYQMPGNVSEWCEDCWNDTHRGATSNPAPRLTGECTHRVLRGGSWVNSPRNLRSANRIKSNAKHRDFNVGFRAVRSI